MSQTRPKLKKNQVQLIASGDLRQSANEVCWPAQVEMEQALTAAVRDHDLVVRQGGDEFAVVAPETDRPAASQLGARLQAAVAEISADGTPIGASMGCAWFPDDSDSLEGLLAAADARLRQVKGERPNARTAERRLPSAAPSTAGETTTSTP